MAILDELMPHLAVTVQKHMKTKLKKSMKGFLTPSGQ